MILLWYSLKCSVIELIKTVHTYWPNNNNNGYTESYLLINNIVDNICKTDLLQS